MGCSFLCSSDFCSTLLRHKSLIPLGRNLRTLPAQKTGCGNPPEIDIRIEICHVPRPNASGQTPEGDEESGIEPMKEPPRQHNRNKGADALNRQDLPSQKWCVAGDELTVEGNED